MRILVACEESQVVAQAFRDLGHQAYSCDLLETSGDHPEYHFVGDVLPFLDFKWDMVIAFPPCTHLSASGARWWKEKQADGRQGKAMDFFMAFVERTRHIPMVAIENPIGIMSSMYRKPDQIIQPYQFGHDASKSTCLWLKGLPKLEPTKFIEPRFVDGKARWANQTDSGQNKLTPSPERAAERSKTYPGIALAMADQWSKHYEREHERTLARQLPAKRE